jgi:sugar transferase (PEP-CTERM/EpsH1 system associated)
MVDTLTRRLASRYHFVIACLDEVGDLGERLIGDGFEVVQLHRRAGFDWRCVRRLGRFLEANNVQVVHAHQYTPFAYAAATRLFGRRPRIVFTEHGRFYPDMTSRKRRAFNRLVVSRLDRLVAVGESVRQALIEKEGLPASRIQVIYNGIDLEPVKLTPRQRSELRKVMGASDEDFLVVQVARLDTIKDHPTALRVIAAASREDSSLRLAIVGDGPEKANIERQVHELSLNKHVRLLGKRDDVAHLLAAADAFLLTSVSEGIPVTIIEALAAGVPVVATAVGGVPEVIDDGISGLLAPAGDVSALAVALLRLARDAALQEKFACEGAKRASERFSEDRMIERYASIYRDILHCDCDDALGRTPDETIAAAGSVK